MSQAECQAPGMYFYWCCLKKRGIDLASLNTRMYLYGDRNCRFLAVVSISHLAGNGGNPTCLIDTSSVLQSLSWLFLQIVSYYILTLCLQNQTRQLRTLLISAKRFNLSLFCISNHKLCLEQNCGAPSKN